KSRKMQDGELDDYIPNGVRHSPVCRGHGRICARSAADSNSVRAARKEEPAMGSNDEQTVRAKGIGEVDGCLSEDQVLAFAHGRASSELRSAAEQHLDRCSVCLQKVAAMGNAPLAPTQPALAVTISTGPKDQGAPSPIARASLAPGTRINERYHILAEIGSGG